MYLIGNDQRQGCFITLCCYAMPLVPPLSPCCPPVVFRSSQGEGEGGRRTKLSHSEALEHTQLIVYQFKRATVHGGLLESGVGVSHMKGAGVGVVRQRE